METIIQDRYGGILRKQFVFYLLDTSWPLYQSAGRNCIAFLQCSGNGSVVGDWWGRDGVLARGGWLLPVGWTVNTGFYLFLETAFQWSFSLTDGSGWEGRLVACGMIRSYW